MKQGPEHNLSLLHWLKSKKKKEEIEKREVGKRERGKEGRGRGPEEEEQDKKKKIENAKHDLIIIIIGISIAPSI